MGYLYHKEVDYFNIQFDFLIVVRNLIDRVHLQYHSQGKVYIKKINVSDCCCVIFTEHVMFNKSFEQLKTNLLNNYIELLQFVVQDYNISNTENTLVGVYNVLNEFEQIAKYLNLKF